MNAKAQTLLDAFQALPRGAVVVEIGCVRRDDEVGSDGYSTVYLAAAAEERGWRMHSVDNDPAAVKIARELTTGIGVHEADGAEWLRAFPSLIDGLYLDGAADQTQALEQYLAASLTEHCVVVVDDVQDIVFDDGSTLARGKAGLLLDRLDEDGFEVRVLDTEPPDYRMAVATR